MNTPSLNYKQSGNRSASGCESTTLAFSPQPLALSLRPYQRAALQNQTNGLEVWMWGRQTGKSFTLACWAVERLLSRPGRLVTILSNSVANGAELNQKCAQIARLYQQALGCGGATLPRSLVELRTPNSPLPASVISVSSVVENSLPIHCDPLVRETRITVVGQTGRIKILPANPRTARGFSGDLILDEFAFHENSAAIWEAAEPILSANPDYLCRVAVWYLLIDFSICRWGFWSLARNERGAYSL